ncbi:toll/interleukin-1 receptor domain-containing protein [Frankia sp. AgB32]|uniref:toll/interleukin-1 receptor domain-containing protein n=1 Tax=Frankia sp. AgB32 TaxID=631119 RepID=UPI00200E698E|nr:toll/interleukin-1 receptor domain-containing protein [Frankia sp. AgB32]MCK9896199.1 toll/interleukin-1 receptor domain-containing protein [Frankia sp. AgB32]
MTQVVQASIFVSWCHRDVTYKDKLLDRLHLGTLADVEITSWQDSDLRIGENWEGRILDQLAACDYGLLLLSPAFFASSYILTKELPRLLGPDADKVLPVMLRRVELDGSRRLYGVDARQIYTGAGGRSFTETRGASRERFALGLASEIRRRILADAA